LIRSWFGKLIMLGSIWALWYHTLGGIRHLIWDNAIGLDIPTAYKLGWTVVIGSFVLTVITVIVL
jgi:succinate dehydrogenase / fumarate reductase cytochrome b subunit